MLTYIITFVHHFAPNIVETPFVNVSWNWDEMTLRLNDGTRWFGHEVIRVSSDRDELIGLKLSRCFFIVSFHMHWFMCLCSLWPWVRDVAMLACSVNQLGWGEIVCKESDSLLLVHKSKLKPILKVIVLQTLIFLVE